MICNSKLFYDLESIFFQGFLGPVGLADTKRTPENYMKLVHRSREGSKEFRLCFSRMGGGGGYYFYSSRGSLGYLSSLKIIRKITNLAWR